MDRFFDRLGDAIKNFLDEDDDKIFGKRGGSGQGFADPDLKDAYDELDEFLKTGQNKPRGAASPGSSSRAWSDPGTHGQSQRKPAPPGPSELLEKDFAELGLPFDASLSDCKAAYKKLLKVHHPDKHAGHPGNMKKATEKSARINAAYQRIEKWRETGKID